MNLNDIQDVNSFLKWIKQSPASNGLEQLELDHLEIVESVAIPNHWTIYVYAIDPWNPYITHNNIHTRRSFYVRAAHFNNKKQAREWIDTYIPNNTRINGHYHIL